MSMVDVRITKDDTEGRVTYSEERHKLSVTHEVPAVEQMVTRYLTDAREYRIPESSKVTDQDRIETALPTDSTMHMELALCELFAHTGVWVHWSPENQTEFPSPDEEEEE